jgi:hypothetical protein
MQAVNGQCDYCFDMTVVVSIEHGRLAFELCFACLTTARNLALNAITPEGPEDYGVGSF